MKKKQKNINLKLLLFLSSSTLLLTGCSDNMVIMNPKGSIALEQKSLILTALVLMLIVVIPAIVMAIFFSIKYRASNFKAKYTPNWSHSKKIEIVVWSVPIIIIIILATITWKSTHTLDPSKPILHGNPIIIQVIALNWKWLFIYPEQRIATINEIAIPVNVPVKFEITSNSVMNSFFIPQLGSQIYAMAGMKSVLYLIANEPGIYKGFSSNFSGEGFSNMKFTVIATSNNFIYHQWIKKVQKSINIINKIEDYEKLAEPNNNYYVQYFSKVKLDIFQKVINKFIKYQSNFG